MLNKGSCMAPANSSMCREGREETFLMKVYRQLQARNWQPPFLNFILGWTLTSVNIPGLQDVSQSRVTLPSEGVRMCWTCVCTIWHCTEHSFPLRDSCVSVAHVAAHLLENPGLSVSVIWGRGSRSEASPSKLDLSLATKLSWIVVFLFFFFNIF